MSYKHVGTAGDLVRFGCMLKIECGYCGVARTLNGVEVHHLNGNRQFPVLQRRLVCKRCKRKEARLTVLSPVYPCQ